MADMLDSAHCLPDVFACKAYQWKGVTLEPCCCINSRNQSLSGLLTADGHASCYKLATNFSGDCLQELAFSDSDSDLEDVGSSSEEGEEEGPDKADPAALTEAEAAAAARVPVPLVLKLWAKNEARMEAEEWLPRRSPDPGVCLSPC